MRRTRRHGSGQAVLELALAAPVILLLLVGMVLVARVIQAELAVLAAAREGARVCAEARSQGDCLIQGAQIARIVANGDGLRTLRVDVDTGGFERGGTVRVTVSSPVPVADLPLVGGIFKNVPIAVVGHAEEQVEIYRSR